jgi:hypothetical protein
MILENIGAIEGMGIIEFLVVTKIFTTTIDIPVSYFSGGRLSEPYL